MAKPILVTGATGNQGGSVISALLSSPEAKDFTLLAVTRNASSEKAQKLADKGIKIVQGDLNDPLALFKSAKEVAGQSIWGVFSVQTPYGLGTSPDTEEKQGKALVDGALENDVKYFVYSSVDRGGEPKSWNNPTHVKHFISKHNVELHLRDKAGDKMKWTILRPTAYMDNWMPGFVGGINSTLLRQYVKDRVLQVVAVKDIGIFATTCFLAPDTYNHKAIALAGDEINFEKANQIIKSKTGEDMPQSYEITSAALTAIISEMSVMYEWFYTDGYGADIKALKEMHPGLLSFSEWVDRESGIQAK